MQVHIVKQMPSVKAGYVDPQAIAQTNFNYPKWCTLDAKELAATKTLREKQHKQRLTTWLKDQNILLRETIESITISRLAEGH